MMSLEWSVLARFLQYVDSVPDGRISVADGAVIGASGVVTFPGLDIDGEILRFRGRLTCTAHRGMLDVVVAYPWIVPGTDHLEVTIDDEVERIAFATARSLIDGGAIPLLTQDGSDLFFGRYPVGYELDPLRIVGMDTRTGHPAP